MSSTTVKGLLGAAMVIPDWVAAMVVEWGMLIVEAVVGTAVRVSTLRWR